MAMDKKDLCNHLISLVHLDIDAIHAYRHAIEKIDVMDIKDQLTRFMHDHERHVQDLSPFIVRFGGQVPAFNPDFKGYLIQGMTALRSVTGTEGALKAMKSNEELTNKNYESALRWDMPEDVRAVIVRGRDDERRHLDYVNQVINDRVWENRQAA